MNNVLVMITAQRDKLQRALQAYAEQAYPPMPKKVEKAFVRMDVAHAVFRDDGVAVVPIKGCGNGTRYGLCMRVYVKDNIFNPRLWYVAGLEVVKKW